MLRNLLRRERLLPGRRIATAAAALILTAAGLTVASPAYAEQFPIADSFENNPYDRWTVWQVPGLTSVSIGAHATRGRTGPNLAYLHAYPDSPSFASVFRTITPDNAARRPLACKFILWIARVANAGEKAGETVDLFLRIRQGGPTGQIIANKGVTVAETRAWDVYDSTSIPWPTDTITVEISAYRGSAFVDDVAFRCSEV
jgi:hypothetical protein